MLIQITTKGHLCFFPGLIEHLEVVVVHLDVQQITHVHRMHLNFIDKEERDYLKHDLPACEHWTIVLVLSFP